MDSWVITRSTTRTLNLSIYLSSFLSLSINLQAQQEAILDWTPEAKWVDGLHVRADRAEQIAQEITKRSPRR